MEDIDLLEQIKRKLTALQARIEARADPKLLAEVADTIRLADVHLPSVFMQARRVLEIIVRDIYRRELPDAKPKPLHNMIEALYQQKGLIDARIAGDLHYIRVNGNLITHAQDEPVEPDPGHAERVLFVFSGVVEWYLEDYLPACTGTAPAAEPAVEPKGPAPASPYRGLAPFRPQDAPNYFGREPDVADLTKAVARQPLLAVVGPSGSGKSSLLQAGLLPALAADPGPAGPWLAATFRPGARPFHQLARALLDHWPLDDLDRLARTPKLAAALAADEITLADAAAETLRQAAAPDQAAPPSRLLLIADQFEELFTLAPTPGTEPQAPRPERFIDRLVAAVAATPAGPPPSLCLLLALRADFLGHALAHPNLAALLDRHKPKLLGAIADRDRLRSIIEQPARNAGVLLEDLLPERILRDLGQLPDDPERPGGASLPLLQFTLAQLWERQQGRRLTHRAYDALGGIEHALSGHADAVLKALDPADQARMRHCLVQMVRPGEGTEDTRQVATRDQLRPDDWPLITRLADQHARLVVTGHDPATDQDTAELVHEALIRHWQPLRRWISEDRAFRLWQNGLRQAIAEWRRTDQDPGALLAGARLAEAEDRVEQDRERLAEAEIAFIAASVARRDAEAAERERLLAEKAELAERQAATERAGRRRARSMALGFGVLALLMLALVVLLAAQWQQTLRAERLADEARSEALSEARAAEDARRQAQQQKSLAENERTRADSARERAEHEQQRAEQERARAEREAERASMTLGVAHLAEARRILLSTQDSRASGAYKEALIHVLEGQRQRLPNTDGSNDFRQLDMSAEDVAAAFGRELWSSPSFYIGEGVVDLRVSYSGKLAATAHQGGDIALWSFPPGRRLNVLRNPGATAEALAISPDESLMAAAFNDGTIRVWDVATGTLRKTTRIEDSTLLDLELSDTTLFVSLYPVVWEREQAESTIVTIDLSTGSIVERLPLPDTVAENVIIIRERDGSRLHLPAVIANDIILTQDGSLLLAACTDGLTRIWRLLPELERLPRIIPEPLAGDAYPSLQRIAVSADGDFFATLDVTGTIVVRDLEAGEMFRSIDPAPNADSWSMPSGLDFSPDGLKLAVANSNEGFLIDIYSTATIRSLWLHDAPISAIRYQPIDGTVLSASDDGLVVRWNPEPPSGDRSFFGHKRHVRAVEFDGSGAMLASVAADGFGARWDLGSGVPLNSFFPKQGSYDLFNDIAIAPSGNAIALAEIAPPFVALFSVEETEAKFQWAQKLSNIVTRVEISPDGKIVAAGDLNGQLALFSASDGELFGTLDATAPVIDIRFNNDSEHLAAAATDGYIRIWSVESLAHQRSWKAHEPGETFLDWSPDNSMIATGGADGKVKLWRLEFEMPAEELVFAQQKGDLPQDQVQSSPTVQVKGVRFHPNAGWLASGHFDGKVRIWGQDGTELIDEIDTGRKRLFSLAVHPNQPVVASGYGSGVIEINRVQPDPVEQRLGDLGRRVTALDLTADGSLILAGTSSGALSLLASTQESVGSSIADHGSWVRAVAVSRDGQKVASAGIDRSIHVRARNGAVLGEPVVLKGHPASVRALAWSPGADVLASSSDAGDVRIWRLPDFTSTTLVGGSSDSSTLAFSRDGRLVFAGGPQSIARWDAETGTEIRSIPLPDEIVTVLTSCDARDVIAVGTDVGTIRLFAPFTGELQGVLLGHYAGIASLSFDPRCRVLSSRSRDGSWIIWDVLGRVPLRHTQNRADVSAGPLFSGAGRSIIFGLANGEVYRHAFAPWDLLIANGSTPSDRASMLSEALQRLWGLRVSGFNLGKDPHHDIGSSEPRVWARTRSRFSLPSFEGLEHFAESDSSEFDMSPLLAPASATGEKLDQVLDWLAEQEERVPRLRPGYEPAAAGRQ